MQLIPRNIQQDRLQAIQQMGDPFSGCTAIIHNDNSIKGRILGLPSSI